MFNNESYNEKSLFENILEILLCYKRLTTVFTESWWNCSFLWTQKYQDHYNDIIMSAMASQITRLMIVYSNVYSGGDQRKHQSSASLAFVRGIQFPTQRASNVENISIWWRHHDICIFPWHDALWPSFKFHAIQGNCAYRAILYMYNCHDICLCPITRSYFSCVMHNYLLHIQSLDGKTAASEQLHCARNYCNSKQNTHMMSDFFYWHINLQDIILWNLNLQCLPLLTSSKRNLLV